MRTCFVGKGDDAIDCWVLRAFFPLSEVLLPPCTLYIREYLYSETSTLINDCFVGVVLRSTVLLTMFVFGLTCYGTGRDSRTRLARKNNFQARTVTGQKNPRSADHAQDWPPYPVDPFFA